MLKKKYKEWKYYRRSVSRTPFYAIEDAIRDITFYIDRKQKGDEKTPPFGKKRLFAASSY